MHTCSLHTQRQQHLAIKSLLGLLLWLCPRFEHTHWEVRGYNVPGELVSVLAHMAEAANVAPAFKQDQAKQKREREYNG